MRSFPEQAPEAPDARTAGRYLVRLAAVSRSAIAAGSALSSTSVVAQALIPAAIGRAVDDGLTGRDQQALLLWGGAVLALAVVQAVTGILHDRCALTAQLAGSFRTLQHVTHQATRLGASLPRQMSAGEVMSVGVADVRQIGTALSMVSLAVGSVAAIVAVTVLMVTSSWQLGLVVLLGVPLTVAVLTAILRPLHVRQTRMRTLQAEVTSRAVDIVGGLRVLRGIGGEAQFASRYQDDSQRVRHSAVRVARVEAVIDAARVLLPGLLMTSVVWLGARSVLDGRLTPGQLVAFYGYAVFLGIPVRRLTFAAASIMKGHVAARRITAMLALRPELDSGAADPRAQEPTAAGSAPPGDADLADPASGLFVRAGRLTAVACAAADDAGMLADRLGRYADSDATLGGVPLRGIQPDEVRRRVLVAGNDARLFGGVLRTELDPREHAVQTPGLLDTAIDTASARDVVDALPDGLDTTIADAGREFSGGQLQRLRLARSLAADPEILVLVEPTSAVDAHTESRIAARLAAARSERTTVVFTTSPILLDHADHVAYVESAKVVAGGTHAELLGDPRYRSVVAREEEDGT